MVMQFYRFWLFCLLTGVFLSGCAEESAEELGKISGPQQLTQYPIKVGGEVVLAELAISEKQQEIGLMHRDEMEENAGMLFVYDEPRRLWFWMKNTRIPLDIGFFDSRGALREVHQMEPFNLNSTASRREDIQFALEMNEGWFRKHGVKVGAVLNLESLAFALKQEGVDPSVYGINYENEEVTND